MVLEEFFSTNLLNSAKMISRDSKIYEAFKVSLLNINGISLSKFMEDKDLRKQYRQKYGNIKTKFQEQSDSKKSISDEDCLRKIALCSKEWEEFISTAKENTIDAGESFIRNIPLERFVVMTPQEKRDLENQLVNAAIQRVRNYTRELDKTSSGELELMLSPVSEEKEDISHKI